VHAEHRTRPRRSQNDEIQSPAISRGPPVAEKATTWHKEKTMILPTIRDPRFTTLRRGGTLSTEDHHLLAAWAAGCAAHVLASFEEARPADRRPRDAIELTAGWIRGDISMTQARVAAYHANAAAKDAAGAAKQAAYAAGQAVAVAHVAAHYLGAAAYALRAVQSLDQTGDRLMAEWQWQIDTLPPPLKALVLEDQKNRNAICWNVFFV